MKEDTRPSVIMKLRKNQKNHVESGRPALSMTTYIAQMSRHQQDQIEKLLRRKGISGEDLERAMNSKLCDLDEVLPVDKLFKQFKALDEAR